MRTTLDIEDDVLLAAKELAARAKTTAGKVISDLARQGLSSAKAGVSIRNGVPVVVSRGEVITNEHVQHVMDQEGI
jgi:hypothetical protein